MSTFENNTTTTTTVPFHNNITHKRRAKTPSFSSILLDAIYRSIDDSYTDTDSSSSHHTHTPKTAITTTTTTTTTDIDDDHNNNARDYNGYSVQASKQRRTKMRSESHLDTIELRHAIIIDSWIEKQPPPPPQQQQQAYYNQHNCYNNADYNSNRSTNTSSTSTSLSTSCFTQQKLCRNNTSRSTNTSTLFDNNQVSKRENSPKIFNKTKLKALKIYNDFKKSKQQQPISPGARIAAFLNSIFRNSVASSPARNLRENIPATVNTPTSSKSCLSNTMNSTEKSNRSVRFYPLSIIVDEDSTSFDYIDGDKSLIPLSGNSMTKAASNDRKWKRDKEIDELITMNKRINRSSDDYKEVMMKIEIESDEEMMNLDEEDDGDSCASSDLFELENFSSIGVSRFSQELPVFGTTKLKNLSS